MTDRFTLLTANLGGTEKLPDRHARRFTLNSENARMAVANVGRIDPDVAFLQEFGARVNIDSLFSGLGYINYFDECSDRCISLKDSFHAGFKDVSTQSYNGFFVLSAVHSKSGRKVSFINVHLLSPMEDMLARKREEQVSFLLPYITEKLNSRELLIAAGDFNYDIHRFKPVVDILVDWVSEKTGRSIPFKSGIKGINEMLGDFFLGRDDLRIHPEIDTRLEAPEPTWEVPVGQAAEVVQNALRRLTSPVRFLRTPISALVKRHSSHLVRHFLTNFDTGSTESRATYPLYTLDYVITNMERSRSKVLSSIEDRIDIEHMPGTNSEFREPFTASRNLMKKRKLLVHNGFMDHVAVACEIRNDLGIARR